MFNGYIDSLVQDCGNSSALAMELPQPYTKSSTCALIYQGGIIGQSYKCSSASESILKDMGKVYQYKTQQSTSKHEPCPQILVCTACAKYDQWGNDIFSIHHLCRYQCNGGCFIYYVGPRQNASFVGSLSNHKILHRRLMDNETFRKMKTINTEFNIISLSPHHARVVGNRYRLMCITLIVKVCCNLLKCLQ